MAGDRLTVPAGVDEEERKQCLYRLPNGARLVDGRGDTWVKRYDHGYVLLRADETETENYVGPYELACDPALAVVTA